MYDEGCVGGKTSEHRRRYAAQLGVIDGAIRRERRRSKAITVRPAGEQPCRVKLIEDAVSRRTRQAGVGGHVVEA